MVAALIAGLTVFGAVFASAASLGGLTSGSVGADNAAVASCDTDGVTTSYATSWDSADDRYEITSVTVANVNNACDGRTLSVSLLNATSDQVGTGSVSIPSDPLATQATVSLSTTAPAKDTVSVHASIA
jgi:hypothetical protein